MRNEKYNWPEQNTTSIKRNQFERSVSKEYPNGKKRWKLFSDIIALAIIVLLLYGVFIYLPSTTTSEINCDNPTEVMLTKRGWHPMIPHPCDTIPTMHPLRHWPK